MTEPSPTSGLTGQATGTMPGQPSSGWPGQQPGAWPGQQPGAWPQPPTNPASGWPSSGAARPGGAGTSAFAGPAGAQATMTRPQPAVAARPVARERTARLVIRRVSPWSVLKVSFLVYCCLELVALLVFAVGWEVLNRLGTFTTVQGFANKLSIHLVFPAGTVFTYYAAVGFGLVLLATLSTVLLCLLFNLVCDIVGGIELTLAERTGRLR